MVVEVRLGEWEIVSMSELQLLPRAQKGQGMCPSSYSKAGTNRVVEKVEDSFSAEVVGLKEQSGVSEWEERAEATEMNEPGAVIQS